MIRSAKNGAGDALADRSGGATDRGKLLIERSGVIAKGDPNAPLPKAPAGDSGTLRPGANTGTKK